MLSGDQPTVLKRALKKRVAKNKDIGRIPPIAENLLQSEAWIEIMADVAITVAVAEIEVYFTIDFIYDFNH